MKLKIAAMLIVSVLMSANTSYGGDLLDRMLGRAGCSSCATPAVKSCGCGGGGGLLDKLFSCGQNSCDNAGILNVDPAPSCGCEEAAVVEASPCGCDAAPVVEASPCGCDAAPVVEASPCGCDAAPVVEDSPCGCDAAPVVEASPCGCEAAPAAKSCGFGGGLLSKLLSCRNNAAPSGGCDAAPAVEASPCGCDAAPVVEASPCGCDAAPVVEASPCGGDAAAPSCGCEATPMSESPTVFASAPEMVPPFASAAAPADCGCGSGGGFLSRLKAMGCKSGCGSAPAVEASPCGCDAAPAVEASTCGCEAAPVATSSSCGCDAAPAVSTCGCEAASAGCRSGGGGTVRPRLSLLDRLKGNRVPRDRNGKVLGVCNDGCNPPCPVQPVADCGCGSYVEAPYVEAAPCSSCSTCGGGEVIYSDAMPASGCANGACGSTPIYGQPIALPAAAAATSEGSGTRVDPVAPPATEGTLQSVEEVEDTDRRDVTQPSISDGEDDPIVDPGAFAPRSTNTMGS